MPKINIACVVICLWVLCGAAPTYADDTTDPNATPQIVITPTRTPVDISRLPSDVTVITRQDIESQDMVDLQDAVETLPGVTVSGSGTPGGVTTLFMRGTESAHTLVLLDGMPINDPSNTTGFFDFSNDQLGSIDHIEVVQGPGSVLYGSQAIGGVINLVTRDPEKEGDQNMVDLSGGSNVTAAGEGMASRTFGNWTYLADVEGQHSNGYDTIPGRIAYPNNLGINDGSDAYTLFGKIGYRVDDSTRVVGEIRWRDLDYKVENAASDDPKYYGSGSALNLQLRGDHTWLDNAAQSSISVAQQTTHRNYIDNPDDYNIDSATSFLRAGYEGNRTTLDTQHNFHLPDAAGFDDIHFTTGATYTLDSINVSYISNGIYGPYDESANSSQGETGLFEQVEGRWLQRVDLSAGLREDFPDRYADNTTAKTGAVLQLPEIDSRLKTSYGTAYRIPSLFERFGVDDAGLVGNPDLQPERSTSWDAGFEHDFPLGGIPRFATLGSTYFETTINNLIQYTYGTSSAQYLNIARAEINGVETQLKLRPASWLQTHADWTLLNAINASGQSYSSTPAGGQLLRRPHNSGNVGATIWATPQWEIAPQVHLVGPHYDQTYDNQGNFIGRARVGGYSTVDLASNYHVTDSATVYGRMTNLFDRTIESPNGYRQEGFAVRVGLRYNF